MTQRIARGVTANLLKRLKKAVMIQAKISSPFIDTLNMKRKKRQKPNDVSQIITPPKLIR